MAAFGWVMGVWIVTAPRPTPEGIGIMHGEWQVLRWVSRLSQFLWVLGTPLVVGGAWNVGEYRVNGANLHPNAYFAVGAGGVLWALAFIGLSFLALYMSRLADWANDDKLTDGLRLVPYALGIGGALLGGLILARAVFGYQGGGMVTIFAGSTGFLMILVAILQFAWALLQFANLARWSASSRRAKLSVDARRSERILARIDAQKARPIDLDGAVLEGHAPAKPQGKVVERPSDTQPYDLA
jgi:hypothetical protein